ncbi:F0F1 ATP synthase subunit epsilon [uncultured Subdoligranulum sp.]|uniref:ATP synthase epsilon chain n=1 Tax=Candidatus Gemmiger excrementavium TaxID=2838608 RepID=A0A9D2F402_9FIRM|nr:F0F1 ATP synthase subunit epsilon [uncultured Subdoligranulum sp.]HIZ48933.1 F0F1 ATP synthase subunit epsilon [Candidatus Gemmiger excrementavium]
MEKTFQLEILTPERPFFNGPVESLVLPALDGEFGVLADHEPVVTAIEPGVARYKTDGVWHEVVVTQGFAEITADSTVVLVAAAERPDEIDTARAQRAKERAEERLRQHESKQEYFRSKAALARATARLHGSHKG